MARERMVTRTLNILEVTALCMDIANAKAVTEKLELTGMTADDPDAALKALKKAHDDATFTVVSIISMTAREELYGMKELDFFAKAVRLDPETRKRLTEN